MSEQASKSTAQEARNNSVLRRRLTVGAVAGVMAVGSLFASQEMSTQYQKDIMDCVERYDGDVEQCTSLDAEVSVGSDHSGLVEFAGYGLAFLSAVSLLGAYREAE